MATFSELLASIAHAPDGRASLNVPEAWMQGRTTYGGLTAALCHEAGRPLAQGRPLRSAQIAFIGPVGGQISLDAAVLREGKNTIFVGVDVLGEKGIGARATFVFGTARPGTITHLAAPKQPEISPIDTLEDPFPRGIGPAFMQNFDVKLEFGPPPMSGADAADIGLWMRHGDREAKDDVTALLAIGDVPPPAAFSLFAGPARMSSMNWSVDVLTDTPQTEDGWWFARHKAETLKDGYSSQAMSLWNANGDPIMLSRQTIAIFGVSPSDQ
ncbi:MAG: thioesterase family protein [Pseudomonadota bacterium]